MLAQKEKILLIVNRDNEGTRDKRCSNLISISLSLSLHSSTSSLSFVVPKVPPFPSVLLFVVSVSRRHRRRRRCCPCVSLRLSINTHRANNNDCRGKQASICPVDQVLTTYLPNNRKFNRNLKSHVVIILEKSNTAANNFGVLTRAV